MSERLPEGGELPAASRDAPRRRLRGRLVGSFLTLALVTVAMVAVVAFYQSREALQRSKFDSLSSIALVKEGVLNRWVDEQRNAMLLVSELSRLPSLVSAFQESTGNLGRTRARSELRLFLEGAATRVDLTELFVMSPTGGEVLASTDYERVGDYRVDDLFYQHGKLETFVQNVYASPVTSRPTMTVATPVRNSEGQTVGVLAAHLNLASIDRLLADRAGLGTTGEAYLVSAFNDFVSAERFGRDESLRGVHTVGIRDALSGKNGTGLYENYDGVPVIGVYRWSRDRELALMVELGQAEAFAPARVLVTTILGIGLISALILTLGIYSLARQIAEPIVDLSNAAQRVAEGDFSVTAAVSTDDEVGVLASAFNTMTRRLEELYRNLEEQIEARSRAMKDLAEARDLAESATRAKTEFLARMSHEIRTPLNAVIGLAHLMSRTGIDETQRDYVQKIQHSGEHLLGVINEILDFSRMEAKGMEIEQATFDLDELLERLPLASGESSVEIVLQLRPDVPRLLIGDPFRLSQVLTNLLGNAQKFTRAGEIHLLVEHSSESVDGAEVELRFLVRDTGIGIDAASAERLFESFSQADGSTTRRHGGSGLGLAICRQIVDLMGGQICAHGEPGVGSTFAFTARFLRVPESRRGPLAFHELEGRRVLVFHSLETMLRASEECFAAHGVRVVAANTEDALRHAIDAHRSGREPIEAFVGDWSSLPVAMGSVRALDVLADVPSILLASTDEKAIAHHGTSSWGRVLVAHKPAVRSTLLQTLGAIFSPQSTHVPDDLTGRSNPLEHRRVLVVDDNEINQQIVSSLLVQAGAEVEVASGGHQALSRLEDLDFDAAVVDIRMPDMNGFELARIVREREEPGKHLPLLALSADPLAKDDERATRDFDDYLTKPIDPTILVNAVASGMRVARPIEAGPEESSSSTVPVLDSAAGLARAAGDETLYRRLLQSFLEGQSGIVNDLDPAREVDMGRGPEERLHDLKGIAANLGAMRVAQVAQRLLSKLRDQSGFDSRLETTDTVELQRAIDAVRVEIGGGPAPVHSAADAAALPPSGEPAMAGLESPARETRS